jgi:hypothetical protein
LNRPKYPIAASKMKTCVNFKSDLFKPFLPEASQVNPGRYGAELAYWLTRKLSEKGVCTSYPEHEDWGWFIEFVTEEEDEYWLCCGNVDGTYKEWQIFIDPKPKGLFGRKKANVENARPLMSAVKTVLEECDQISEIEWHNESQA